MEQSTHDAVGKVIDVMWERYADPLSLGDLADAALLSKFYLSRVFTEATGASPFRFLTAIRIHEAKRMLRLSRLSVTDVACQVGYSSLGTFTSRFTRSVGLPPGKYRDLSRSGLPPVSVAPADGGVAETATLHGTVTIPCTEIPVRVYVGAFKSPIMEGRPVSWDVLDSSGAYRLTGATDGVWFIRAAAVAVRPDDTCLRNPQPVFVAGSRALRIGADEPTRLDMRMKEMCPFDLPVLLALPELDRQPTRARPWTF